MANGKRDGSIITTSIDAGTGTLKIRVVGVEAPIVLRMRDMSDECREYAALHGMKQRIADAAALSRDEDTGLPATPKAKWEAMAELAAYYASGTTEWARRATGTGGGAGEGVTLRAAAEVQGTDVDTMRERADRAAEKNGTTRKAVLAKWAKYPAIATVIVRMRAEAAGLDADALADELAGE